MRQGGQVIKYTAMLACGNYNGVIGFAKAKAPAVPIALQKVSELNMHSNLYCCLRICESTLKGITSPDCLVNKKMFHL